MNYYELLEISPSASVEVIRNAYKTLAKKYHPDTYKGDITFAEEKMKLLNEAISVLEDEGKRNEYNKINGITQTGAYPEYGRANVLNVDENGESIFFSYEAEGAEMPEGDNPSYMDIIDSFIKNSESDKKSKKKAEKEIRDTQPEEADTFENYPIDAEDAEEENYAEYDETLGDGYGEETAEPDPDEPEKDEPKAAAKDKFDRTKIYYIVVASMITVIIFLAAMILRSVDFENIRQLFSAASNKDKQEALENPGGAETGQTGPAEQDTSDTAEQDTSYDIVLETEATIEIETEETTESTEPAGPTEPETPASTKAPATSPPATTPPTQPTRPPATEAPATQAPTVPTTTKPPVVPTRPVPTPPVSTEPPVTEPIPTEPLTEHTAEPTAEPATLPPEPTEPATPEPTAAETAEPTLAPLEPEGLYTDEET